MNPETLELLRARLCELHDHILRRVLEARRCGGVEAFSQIAAVTAADTIFHVDKISEEAIAEWFAVDWPAGQSVELVMEGLEEPLTFPASTPVAETKWICIIDPIDGTRNIMYDKRSAWILSALAPRTASAASLGDLVIAAMTEIPVSKQTLADQVSAIRGNGVVAVRMNLLTGERVPLPLQPSKATHFHQGFAAISRFFPQGKALLAALEEELWSILCQPRDSAEPLVFEDQYISTGGQIYELICGHDRMLADLRPLAFAKLGLNSPLACHPYDICSALILEELGGVVEAPLGGPLNVPLDTTSAVSWIGYANAELANLARPVFHRLIHKHLS